MEGDSRGRSRRRGYSKIPHWPSLLSWSLSAPEDLFLRTFLRCMQEPSRVSMTTRTEGQTWTPTLQEVTRSLIRKPVLAILPPPPVRTRRDEARSTFLRRQENGALSLAFALLLSLSRSVLQSSLRLEHSPSLACAASPTTGLAWEGPFAVADSSARLSECFLPCAFLRSLRRFCRSLRRSSVFLCALGTSM